ncbi:MAG: amidase [Proteobacteria bacterium]|nr:amidase [Burkholderiales bacterium]
MVRWNNPHAISFTAARANFITGSDTPRDLLERCIATIEAREPVLKAWVTLDFEGARAAADASSARYRARQPLSPVDGCPLAVKDIIATRDLPTQMNSPAFDGWHSHYDAAPVHAMRKGGAVIVGKTVTTEFAVGYAGATTNAFDPLRTPGGSSSGSAAAVGAGMVPVAFGTQTQGSTIRPASYNGAVGFKPTHGTLPLGGVHPLSRTLDHLGIIGATLDDVWCTASQTSVALGSPGQRPLTGAGPVAPAAVKPRRLIHLHTKGWTEIDSATEAAFGAFTAALVDRGVRVISRDNDRRVAQLEAKLDAWVDSGLDILAYEMRWPFEEYVQRHGTLIGERIRTMIDKAQSITPERYEALLVARTRMQAEVRSVAGGTDGFITLPCSSIAPQGFTFTGSRTFLAYWSGLGFPTFSLPLLSVDEMPLGVQWMGLDHEDGRLAATANWGMRELNQRTEVHSEGLSPR